MFWFLKLFGGALHLPVLELDRREPAENGNGNLQLAAVRINFIDSTGIGELVGYLGRFRNSKRELILVNPSERIRKLLQVARLDALFPTYDSIEAAVAAER